MKETLKTYNLLTDSFIKCPAYGVDGHVSLQSSVSHTSKHVLLISLHAKLLNCPTFYQVVYLCLSCPPS
jgi:hypothetical protein